MKFVFAIPILHAPFLLDSLDVFLGAELGEAVGDRVVVLGEGGVLLWAIALGEIGVVVGK
jgi:hypothetical protein